MANCFCGQPSLARGIIELIVHNQKGVHQIRSFRTAADSSPLRHDSAAAPDPSVAECFSLDNIRADDSKKNLF